MHHIFIYLSVGAIQWQLQCFATILLHHALVKVTSVLVLFVIFRGSFQLNIQVCLNMLPLDALVIYPVTLHSALLSRDSRAVNELEVVDCTYGLTFLSPCDIFSRHKKTAWLQSTCKIKYLYNLFYVTFDCITLQSKGAFQLLNIFPLGFWNSRGGSLYSLSNHLLRFDTEKLSIY